MTVEDIQQPSAETEGAPEPMLHRFILARPGKQTVQTTVDVSPDGDDLLDMFPNFTRPVVLVVRLRRNGDIAYDHFCTEYADDKEPVTGYNFDSTGGALTVHAVFNGDQESRQFIVAYAPQAWLEYWPFLMVHVSPDRVPHIDDDDFVE